MTPTSPVADRGSVAADEGTLRALEFGAIVARLADLAGFEPARELALASLPSPDAVLVGLLQDQTDEASRLLEEQAQASIGGARDIRGSLDRAARGGRLTPAELLEVGETLEATARFQARLKTWREPHLAGLRDELDPAPELARDIGRSIDEAGEILDTASSELAAIRKRLRTSQDRVRERLNAMLRSSALAGLIGEPIVTMRSGRYVIPIRAEAKGRVKGIVHDQSASGATLFVEPLG
ncbi:MAG: endonuclease MutS2, partial [Candidatus Limnocylindria bacterium]